MFNSNNYNNNNNNNVETVRILTKDDDENVLFLSNGLVISLSEYLGPDGYGGIKKNVVQRGYFINTNNPNVAAILNMNKTQIGELINNNGNIYATFYHKQQQNTVSGGIQVYGGNNDGGFNNGINSGGLNVPGGTSSGSVNIGNNNINTNMHQFNIEQNTQQNTAPVQQQKAAPAPLLAGYEFLPIPTTYTDLRFIPIGDFRKYEIIIKKDKNMDTSIHNGVYENLKEESKKEESLFGLIDAPMLDITSTTSIASAINMAQVSKNVHNIFYGYKINWAISSIKKKESNAAVNDIVSYVEETDTYYTNHLVDLISRSNGSLEVLLRNIDNYLVNKPSGILLKEAIADIMNEEYKMVNDAITIDPKYVVSLVDTYLTIVDAVKKNFDDINIINEFDRARDNIYRRLTLKESLDQFSVVGNLCLEGMIAGKMVDGAGFQESYLCLTTRNANIITELSVLLNDLDKNTFLIDVNTPNTLKVISDLMTGNVRFEKDVKDTFNIEHFATNTYQMVLYVLGAMFKVFRKDNKYYITRTL